MVITVNKPSLECCSLYFSVLQLTIYLAHSFRDKTNPAVDAGPGSIRRLNMPITPQDRIGLDVMINLYAS